MKTIKSNKISTNIYDFASVNSEKLYEDLYNLAEKEYWGKPKERNKYPILANYIIHTFNRLANLYNSSTSLEEKNKYIVFENDRAIINTGLYTDQYNKIYMLFKESKNKGQINPITQKEYQSYYCIGFFEEASYDVLNFSVLPQKARYITQIEDLIYDTDLDLVVQVSHILQDDANRDRIPQQYLKNEEQLKILLSGAIEQVKKRVSTNYKLAIPQFYNNQPQLLLPLSLSGSKKPDLVLSVTKVGNKYRGSTCLTIEQAYNNARLLAKPESEWLTIK